MLSNLVISFGIFCLGFWLKGFDSVFAKIGGWILLIFGFLAVFQALKYFMTMAKGIQMQRKHPELAAAIDQAMREQRSTQESMKHGHSSGATYEQVTEEFKIEVDRLVREHPSQIMGDIFSMAADNIKKRHPQFDVKNQ